MIGLLCAEETIMIRKAASIRDRQTDGQTERIAINIARISVRHTEVSFVGHGRVAQSDRIGPRMRSLKSHMYDFLAVNTDQHRIICWSINYYM